MCGLAGFITGPQRLSQPEAQAALLRMSEILRFRGPDDRGTWTDPGTGVALCHRRLAILDLTPDGRQPMVSHCGRFVISFNGEIYNFREIASKLANDPRNPGWRGTSDTAIMLAAISAWGVRQALLQFNGMFAFALWDIGNQTLTLARDRLGEKPLYYGFAGDSFLFGSELKALRVHPDWQGEIEADVLAPYLRHGYVPSPFSIYRDIWKLPAGNSLTVPVRPDGGIDRAVMPQAYWQLSEEIARGLAHPFSGNEVEAADELEHRLAASIRMRLASDVPLGAFLSGGVDSSTIVALMQRESSRAVKTFSIGFHAADFDEAQHAKLVARHLGTDHTEQYVEWEDALGVIPRLPQLYDEPFADSSQIPTLLVSELARTKVTVVLTGDGGDELFAGYDRYQRTRRAWEQLQRFPRSLRSGARRLLYPWRGMVSHPKSQELLAALTIDSEREFYQRRIWQWKEPHTILRMGQPSQESHTTEPASGLQLDFTQYMMYCDAMHYLPDDILVKVDRASMGVGLEVRVPLLDHTLVGFIWSLPLALSIRGNKTKCILRDVLARHLTRQLIERPKKGFCVTIGQWLRGSLRDWAEDLLSEASLLNEGYFRPAGIRAAWRQHLSGQRDLGNRLWTILMFQAWIREQRGEFAISKGRIEGHQQCA